MNNNSIITLLSKCKSFSKDECPKHKCYGVLRILVYHIVVLAHLLNCVVFSLNILFFYTSSSCIAALLGARVILTDLPDRLRLLRKNVETNLYGELKGSATVNELTWGYNLDPDLRDPSPDYGIMLIF